VARISLAQQVRSIEIEVTAIVSAAADYPDREMQRIAKEIAHQLIDARLEARDYEYAETRSDQLRYAAEGRKRLHSVRQSIVKMSENGLFTAVEVAQITARIDTIIEQLS
jgi:uncharacterized protein involved in type VI secretion and phage assembly